MPKDDSSKRALQALGQTMCERYRSQGEGRAPVVLFVLGAGASFRSGMPSWNKIRDRLITTAKNCFHGDNFIHEAWTQLAPYLGPAPAGSAAVLEQALWASATTEQILGVACGFEVVRKQVVSLLAETYRRSEDPRVGEAPQLGYELIAHFLRHGFIDHVVNFNFDEALDVALDNELGSHGYRRLLSDGDMLAGEESGFDQARLPHHLKLHGTISVPSSLRFTKDHTQTIPLAMLQALDRLTIREGPPRLHLVTLGYSWNDPDFVHWVVARVEHIRSITIVREKEERLPALLLARFQDRAERTNKSGARHHDIRRLARTVTTSALPPLDKGLVTAIDDLLWALANGIESALSAEKTAFVPVARHVVLGHIFGPARQKLDAKKVPIPWEFDWLNKHDTRKRLRLELWLHLFKCKGMLTVSGMAETPRIQRYIEALDVSAAGLEGQLPRGIRANSPVQVRETLFHDGCNAKEAFLSLDADRAFDFRRDAVAVPSLDLETGELRVRRVAGKLLLQELLETIWLSDETEVTTSPEPRARWLFAEPRPLTSHLALRKQTQELLRTPWTHLLVIAESGEWLARHASGLHHPELEREILLIRVGDEGFVDPALATWAAWPQIKLGNESLFQDGPRVWQKTLPWWRHNRHLTLAVTLPEAGPLDFQQGIYFRRRLKTSRIAPVFLQDAADCQELFLVFLAYSLRALELPHDAGQGSVTDPFVTALSRLAWRLRSSWGDSRLNAFLSQLPAVQAPCPP